MTTRSRFAAVIGVAGLAVAAAQLAVLTGPPSALQLLVIAFWGVVGAAYVASAWGQRLRERIRPRHRVGRARHRTGAVVASVAPVVAPIVAADATGQTGPIALG